MNALVPPFESVPATGTLRHGVAELLPNRSQSDDGLASRNLVFHFSIELNATHTCRRCSVGIKWEVNELSSAYLDVGDH